MTTTRRLAAVAAAALLAAGSARAAPPGLLTYSGFLQDGAGTPLSGVHDFTVRFYSAHVGGTQIGSDVLVSTSVGSDGYFSVVLDVSPFSALLTGQAYMAVKVDSDASFMTPRIQLTSVPGALSVPFLGITDWPISACPAGQFAVGYDVNGQLRCGAATAAGVSSVAAGPGVTVSGTGAVTVSANLAPAGGDAGSAATIARSDHTHGALYAAADHGHDAVYPTAASLAGAGTLNAPGNPVDWTRLKGVPAGFADGTDDGLVGVVGSGPIVVTGGSATATIGLQPCAAGQVLKSTGGGWACQADQVNGGTVTAVAALAPLFVTSATTTPSISLPPATSLEPGYLTTTDWLTFAAKQGRVTGTCPAGQYVVGVKADGGVDCRADANSGGTVTSITAGSGLGGGTITGSGTIFVAEESINTLHLVDGGIAFSDWAQNGCGPGEVPKWGGTMWSCRPDNDTTYTAGPGLTLSGGQLSLTSTSCAPGYVLRWNGSGWQCQPSVTSVTGSSPITVANGTTTPAISISAASGVSPGYLTTTDHATFSGKQNRVTGTCANGTSIVSVNANGTVVCTSDQYTSMSSGSLTPLDPGGATTILSPTVGFAVQPGQRVHWVSSVAMGSGVASGGLGLQIYPCFKQLGSSWVTLGGNLAQLTVPQNHRHVFTISGTYTVSASGTYYFGMCANSSNSTSWNWNDYGYTSGLVVN